MKIKIGDTIEHGGEQFVITHIHHSQTIDGMCIQIVGFDSDSANEKQKMQIQSSQLNKGFLDLLKKLLDDGKSGGFVIGG